MKKLMILFALILIGCNDSDLPDLPDGENTSDAPVLDLDIVENDESFESDLIIATVGGYDVPFSGKVLFSNDESLEGLKFVHDDMPMGSSDGSDLAIGDWNGGFFILGRHTASTVYFFYSNEKEGFDFSSFDLGQGNYINLQEGVYNNFKDEFIFSALNSNYLIILKEDTISKLQISENANASPAKMKIIGSKLFVAMQNLNESWQPVSGEMAVIDMETYSVRRFGLTSKNPVGKIEYNRLVDSCHLYVACSGSWQKRDGAILRIDIETFESTEILKESDNGGLLDGDFVDLTIADNGDFYIVFSNNSDRWINRLLKYDTKKGVVSEIDSGVNAFAANPVDFSPVTKKIYYFADSGADTYLRSLDTVTGEKNEKKMEAGPSAVKVRVRNINN